MFSSQRLVSLVITFLAGVACTFLPGQANTTMLSREDILGLRSAADFVNPTCDIPVELRRTTRGTVQRSPVFGEDD